MITVWGTLTIGASPVQISSTYLPVCKVAFQVVPGATGRVKIGAACLTSDTSTPGTFLNSSVATNSDGSVKPGDMWIVESQQDSNRLDASTYWLHGTHAGDTVNYEYHQG